MTAVRQVERYGWVRWQAIPAAVITPEPVELAERLGVRFEHDLVDDDLCELAVLQLPSGVSLELRRQVTSTFPGTQLWVDESLEHRQVVDEFLSVTGLPSSVVTWRYGVGRV
ncbi:MAG TPA: hypothetical protein VIL00_08835 [Pseudonocardiaceae bacterium]